MATCRVIESLENRILLATRFVDVNSHGLVQDGTSWNTAHLDLQAALDASVSGDEIRVADGIYKPTSGTDRTISFVIKNGVSVLGGYAGSGSANPDARNIASHPTHLSGDIGSIGDTTDNSYHVVTGTGTRIDGFTITDGNAIGDPVSEWGGGLQDGNGIIQGCTFINNQAATGGAIGFISQFSTATVRNCTFISNRALSYGGAIGGELPSFKIIGCLFLGNSSGSYGGAYFSYSNFTPPAPTLTNCIFVGNSAPTGGAVFVEAGGGSQPILAMTNCVLAYNVGAGIHILGYSQTPSVPLSNCIFWGNRVSGAAQQIEYSGTPPDVTHSVVEAGWAGTGNVSANPQFLRDPNPGPDLVWGSLDDDRGDLRLTLTSPGIDAGDNSIVPPDISTDYAGNARFVDVPTVNDPGAIVDMGAYEYIAPLAAITGAYLVDTSLPKISVLFNGDVDPTSLSTGDLVIVDPVSNLPIPGLPVPVASYDVGTRTAIWAFSAPLPDGNYRAKIFAGSVADLLGNVLGADVTFDYFVLAGDANRDRVVDARDLYILSQNWLGTGKTFSQGDFTFDGVVDQADLTLMAQRWQVKVDAPAAATPGPAAPTGAGRRAPVRTPGRAIQLVM